VAGDTATFQLLLDGKPAADVEVELVPGGIRYRDKLQDTKLKTAADGKFSVKWRVRHVLDGSQRRRPEDHAAAGHPTPRHLHRHRRSAALSTA
jgi:hypothetical protein